MVDWHSPHPHGGDYEPWQGSYKVPLNTPRQLIARLELSRADFRVMAHGCPERVKIPLGPVTPRWADRAVWGCYEGSSEVVNGLETGPLCVLLPYRSNYHLVFRASRWMTITKMSTKTVPAMCQLRSSPDSLTSYCKRRQVFRDQMLNQETLPSTRHNHEE